MVDLTTPVVAVDVAPAGNATQLYGTTNKNILIETDEPVSNRSYSANVTVTADLTSISQVHFYVMHLMHGLIHVGFFIIFILLFRWVKTKLPMGRPLPSIPGRELSPFERALEDPGHKINQGPLENTYLEPEV